MAHALTFDHETDLDAVFVCANCGATIGFNKADTSESHAVKVGNEYRIKKQEVQAPVFAWLGE